MSKTISFRGGKAIASVVDSGGDPVTFPVFTLPATTRFIGDVGGDGNPSALYLAFTPTNTTVTINPTGENAVTFTNATARVSLCTADPISGSYFLFARARRKPGTTGAIAAQTIRIYIDDTPDKEFGLFNVEAAAEGADPVSGFVSCFYVANVGDSRMNLGATSLKVDVSAADSDLEIEITIAGYQD